MYVTRNLANSLFSVAAAQLADLSPSAGVDAYRVVRTVTGLMGRSLPEKLDPRVMNGMIGLISDGLSRTPYGFPIEFEHPLLITLSALSYCPFACTNCYANSDAKRAQGRTEDRLQLFAKVAAAKTPFVIVSGGEPLVADGIEESLKLLIDSGKFVWVSTNALVDKTVAFARRHEGSLRFVLPVWGNRERHDARRGKNSFERIERNLTMLGGAGLKADILVVLADVDFSVLGTVEELARAHCIDKVTVTRVIEAGRNEAGPFELGADQLRQLKAAKRSLERHVRMVICDLPEMQENRGRGLMQRVLGLGTYDGCSAGNWMMHVDDHGRGHACFSFEGQTGERVSSDLPIFEQWRAIRRSRAAFPTGALCVEKRRGISKETVL